MMDTANTEGLAANLDMRGHVKGMADTLLIWWPGGWVVETT